MDRFNRLGIIGTFLLALTILIYGCMKIGPDYQSPPTAISTDWLEAHDERIKTGPVDYRAWWEAFDDPILNSVIDRAYHENITLKIAGVRVLEARAQLGVAVGDLYPQTQQVGGSLTYNRSSERMSFATGAQSSGQSFINFNYWQDQVNLNAAWELDFWGKFRRAVESADAGLRAAVADYDNALVSLTADAASYYIQIRTLQKRLDIARQNVETQRENLRIAEARYKGGATSELDVEQAKSSLFNTQAIVPTLESLLRQAKNALSVLLGLPPGAVDSMVDEVKAIPAPPLQVAVGIPADLLRRRPDVRSAEERAVSQSALIGVAKAELYPAFSLTGSFGFLSTNAGSFSLTDIADWRARTATAGPSFQWNIFNYGRITNNVRVQDARLQQLLLSYQNTVLTAQQEVEDSLSAFLRAQENAEYLALSARAARKSFDLALIQYRNGSVDFTTVLVAQQNLLTAQDSFASALGAISGNLVSVYRALGGGWMIREGQDLVSPEIKELMARRTNWGKLLELAVYIPAASPQSTIRAPDW